MQSQLLLELLMVGGVAGVKVGIAALGFALIFYTTRELHFAFGAICILGGYICYWTVAALGLGLPGVILGVVAAFLVTALVSVAMHKYLYLRLRDITPVLMVSLGASIILENVLQIVATPDVQILSYPSLTRIVELGFLRIRLLDIGVIVLFAAIAIFLDVFLNRTRLGQGLAATIEDPQMAELVGIRTQRMRIGAYCAGTILGTTSGIISLLDTGIKPANGFLLLLYALIVTIMGRGSLRAVAIWSLAFGIARSLWSWQFATDYTDLAVFAMVVVYLMFRDTWNRYRRDRVKPAGSRPKMVAAPRTEEA